MLEKESEPFDQMVKKLLAHINIDIVKSIFSRIKHLFCSFVNMRSKNSVFCLKMYFLKLLREVTAPKPLAVCFSLGDSLRCMIFLHSKCFYMYAPKSLRNVY